MATGTTTCPGSSLLEALASGAPVSEEIGAHIARCAKCAEYLSSARFSRRFAEVMSDTPVTTPTPPSEAPDLFGYQVLGEISRGGQGVIYRAEQLTTGQIVAIKVLHPAGGTLDTTRESRARFLREIQIVASLSAPGIVRLLDSLKLMDGREALVMEYIDGQPLDAWRDAQTPPSEAARLQLLAEIADALHHAHQRGVTHRDLKPSNILVDAQDHPHLLDFGVARHTGVSDRVTLTGQFTGTLAYAAPEQVSPDSGGPDIRTDIYSLGVIGFELLTGRMPYKVDGALDTTVRNILEADPPARTRIGLAMDVWCVLNKACSKRPERRYQSASEFARDLRHAASGEAVDARRDSGWYLTRKSIARHRFAVGVFLALLVGVIGVVAALATGNRRLQGALHESRLNQIHAHLSAGERERAEAVMWTELDRVGSTDVDPESQLWSGTRSERRLLWRAMEMQAQATCLSMTPFRDATDPRMTTLDDGSFGVLTPNGRVRRVDPLTGATIGESQFPVPGRVTAMWLSLDGQDAIVQYPGGVRITSVATGATLAERALTAEFTNARGFVVTPKAIAISAPSGRVVVLDRHTLEPEYESDDLLFGEQPWIDDDGSTVVFLDRRSRLRVIDIASGADRLTPSQPVLVNPPVSSLPQVVATPDLQTVLVSHRDGIEILTRAGDTYRSVRSIATGYMTRISIDPSGSVVAGNAYGDAQLRMWDLVTGAELPALGGHHGAVQTVAFSHDGSRVATVDSQGTFRLWGAPKSVWKESLGRATASAHQIATDPHDRQVFAIDRAASLTVLDRDHPSSNWDIASPVGGVMVATDTTSTRLACADLDGHITLTSIDGRSVTPTRVLSLDAGQTVSACAFATSPERAGILGVATNQGRALLVDADTGAILLDREVDPGTMLSDLCWTPDGAQLIVSTRDGRVLILDGLDFKLVRELKASTTQVRSLAIDRSGTSVYAAGDAGQILRINIESGSIHRSDRLSEHSLFAVAVASTADLVYVGTRNAMIIVVDAHTLEELAAFDARGAVMDLRAGKNAHTLFISALDRPIEVWDFDALARTLPGTRPETP
ncbi:MAG: protein kinase [Phycisphaerales bacterium]|nr:protein kinase [Phycisphaerales bacterium]